MTAIDKALRRMRRLWLLEHSARMALWIAGLTLNAALACLLLHRLAGLSLLSIPVVIALAAVALAATVATGSAKAPPVPALVRLLDARAQTRDLFTSALEFGRTPERFGWLGELTCREASRRADGVVLRPQLALGSPRHWTALGAAAAMLCAAYVGLVAVQAVKRAATTASSAVVRKPAALTPQAGAGKSEAEPAEAPAQGGTLTAAQTEPVKPDEAEPKAIKITNEMIDKYLAQMPVQEPVDLTGVTPIRWDSDDLNIQKNTQGLQQEKIDPVRLDDALLKDLQAAKKKQEEGAAGKEGGVDIAVMGEDKGDKAKGDKGSKGGESLADAVSKDPRGQPSRLAGRLAKKGLPIISAGRAPSNQRGEPRPMELMEFVSALEKSRTERAESAGATALRGGGRAPDQIVRQEDVPESASDLSDAYFGRLRRADR